MPKNKDLNTSKLGCQKQHTVIKSVVLSNGLIANHWEDNDVELLFNDMPVGHILTGPFPKPESTHSFFWGSQYAAFRKDKFQCEGTLDYCLEVASSDRYREDCALMLAAQKIYNEFLKTHEITDGPLQAVWEFFEHFCLQEILRSDSKLEMIKTAAELLVVASITHTLRSNLQPFAFTCLRHTYGYEQTRYNLAGLEKLIQRHQENLAEEVGRVISWQDAVTSYFNELCSEVSSTALEAQKALITKDLPDIEPSAE